MERSAAGTGRFPIPSPRTEVGSYGESLPLTPHTLRARAELGERAAKSSLGPSPIPVAGVLNRVGGGQTRSAGPRMDRRSDALSALVAPFDHFVLSVWRNVPQRECRPEAAEVLSEQERNGRREDDIYYGVKRQEWNQCEVPLYSRNESCRD